MYSETALNIALPQLSAAFGVELALTQGSRLVFVFALALAAVSFVLACRIKSRRRSTVPEGAVIEEQGRPRRIPTT